MEKKKLKPKMSATKEAERVYLKMDMTEEEKDKYLNQALDAIQRVLKEWMEEERAMGREPEAPDVPEIYEIAFDRIAGIERDPENPIFRTISSSPGAKKPNSRPLETFPRHLLDI